MALLKDFLLLIIFLIFFLVVNPWDHTNQLLSFLPVAYMVPWLLHLSLIIVQTELHVFLAILLLLIQLKLTRKCSCVEKWRESIQREVWVSKGQHSPEQELGP